MTTVFYQVGHTVLCYHVIRRDITGHGLPSLSRSDLEVKRQHREASEVVNDSSTSQVRDFRENPARC